MAVVVTGAKGSTWVAAEWIARNALVFLLPALERVSLPTALERFGPPAERPLPAVDLSDVLELPANSALWEKALGAALGAIDAEAGAGWSEPHRFAAFRAAVAGLGDLAAPDGNALVVRLADRTSKILDGAP